MDVIEEAVYRLKQLESRVDEPIGHEIHAVAELLETDAAEWVGTTSAKRLLGIGSENTIKAWAREGKLHSKKDPNGRVRVRRADLLALSRAGRELDLAEAPMSDSELKDLSRSRSARNPWDAPR